ncbi:hypothetical protein DFH11DRAFT_1731500 [Phellopilus nigrolimitatus]|nr:hypothetical protein DFH11DRAFT_1731500 [Phellopilus nigrolimitatus]
MPDIAPPTSDSCSAEYVWLGGATPAQPLDLVREQVGSPPGTGVHTGHARSVSQREICQNGSHRTY